MGKLAAFAWPPGWIEKGTKFCLLYDGAGDTILAKSPNVTSVTKAGVGLYDLLLDIPFNPGLLAITSIYAEDGTGVPLAVTASALGPATIRIHVTTLNGVLADGTVSWLQAQVPDHFAP